MAKKFNWNDELVTVKLNWNIQLPFLHIANGERQRNAVLQQRSVLHVRRGQQVSALFSPKETPNSKWKLEVYDHNETEITIFALHLNSAGKEDNFVEPAALVKMSILNKKGTKVFQQMQMLPSQPTTDYVGFLLSKKDIIESKCQQSDGSLNFYCKILTHAVKSEPISSSADPPVPAIDCTDGGLSSHLEELFNDMSFSDVSFNIGGREFPAHKIILAARSEVFAAMFKHPMREQSTNQIKIEDIEPEVFQEMLRFIYTGRVSTLTMETMSVGLFIAADKYLLDALKLKCENYMLSQMSPDYCLVLLLHGDLQNPTKPLKEAAKFFQRFPSQVTATERWEQMKQQGPVMLCEIQQFVLCKI
jgi:speckle-type POZ protein